MGKQKNAQICHNAKNKEKKALINDLPATKKKNQKEKTEESRTRRNKNRIHVIRGTLQTMSVKIPKKLAWFRIGLEEEKKALDGKERRSPTGSQPKGIRGGESGGGAELKAIAQSVHKNGT